MILETNKFNGMNYNNWLRKLRIVLDFENQGYILNKSPPSALSEDSSPEEHLTFKKWYEDNWKERSIILASMSNDIQKQYDRLDDISLQCSALAISMQFRINILDMSPQK
ncbi:UNVERIFIED_CONTAM: hypothetical protein Sangu_2936300 [Sesamum angustifolium]|uniref:UBN2_3 domain-containing protein n=1 Tax=Sesamum angustifolium TaxID=2727405 RepID=A0AAW2ILY2_9LAMI